MLALAPLCAGSRAQVAETLAVEGAILTRQSLGELKLPLAHDVDGLRLAALGVHGLPSRKLHALQEVRESLDRLASLRLEAGDVLQELDLFRQLLLLELLETALVICKA